MQNRELIFIFFPLVTFYNWNIFIVRGPCLTVWYGDDSILLQQEAIVLQLSGGIKLTENRFIAKHFEQLWKTQWNKEYKSSE